LVDSSGFVLRGFCLCPIILASRLDEAKLDFGKKNGVRSEPLVSHLFQAGAWEARDGDAMARIEVQIISPVPGESKS
jgi:hypothetical protein